jgi:hypothetical protein
MFGGVALVRDQRGFARSVDVSGLTGGPVDIGAFEFAAPIIVSTAADENDGKYHPGDLSLREAIGLAAVLQGADVIEFDSKLTESAPATIGLTTGELNIGSDVKLIGPGTDDLTISAQGSSRVFSIAGGVTATISGLTITDGNAGTGYGGGVYSAGNLSLIDTRIESNTAAQGGGVFQNGGQLTVLRSEIAGNSATAGGGIAATGEGVSTTIESSGVYENSASLFGGLMLLGTATVLNTTVSTNSATTNVGGIYFSGGTATVTNVTVSQNTAGGGTGGIYGGGSVTLQNSIVVDNFVGSVENNFAVNVSTASSYNLLRSGSSGGLDSTNGNVILAAGVNAGLATLAQNGGATKTHALLEGSPAIDAGDDAIAQALELLYDQRGENRYEDGDGDLMSHVDIGAFELALES